MCDWVCLKPTNPMDLPLNETASHAEQKSNFIVRYKHAY